MPTIFIIMGYHVYFWSNENGEPIHVHISKNVVPNATKIWLYSNGDVGVASNSSRIPTKVLNKIMQQIRAAHPAIVQRWYNYHGYIKYYR